MWYEIDIVAFEAMTMKWSVVHDCCNPHLQCEWLYLIVSDRALWEINSALKVLLPIAVVSYRIPFRGNYVTKIMVIPYRWYGLQKRVSKNEKQTFSFSETRIFSLNSRYFTFVYHLKVKSRSLTSFGIRKTPKLVFCVITAIHNATDNASCMH